MEILIKRLRQCFKGHKFVRPLNRNKEEMGFGALKIYFRNREIIWKDETDLIQQ